ncbi:MAG TPA: beta-phosphoglucomutase [Bacteroidales bacterium]|nr:beta-phosphoglucomutase [Bacteroidales bacterium]
MDLKGCIFDLDGVIVDTARYHFLAWQRLADEMGFVFTENQNEALKGVSRMASLEILLRVGGIEKNDEEKIELATRKNNWYVEYISRMTPDEILPGSIDLLTMLRSEGILTAIGSASRNAGMILDRTGLRNMFDAIADGNKIHSAKPDPEVFLKGAEELGLAPENCVVFEDAQAGIEAALAGGMKCIGVGSPVNLSCADMIVPDLRNITINEIRNL